MLIELVAHVPTVTTKSTLHMTLLAGGHRSLYFLFKLLRLVADFLRVRSRQLVQHDELGSCT